MPLTRPARLGTSNSMSLDAHNGTVEVTLDGFVGLSVTKGRVVPMLSVEVLLAFRKLVVMVISLAFVDDARKRQAVFL